MINFIKKLKKCKIFCLEILLIYENRAKSRELYKAQLDRNSFETASKNRELITKIQELDVLKSKYDEALETLNESQIISSSQVKLIELNS